MNKSTFQKMSSYTSIVAGFVAFAYAIFFVVFKDVMLSSIALLLLGLLGIEIFIALFGRLKNVNEDFARVAMVLGVLGSFGMAVHGGYDLANAINPPAGVNASLPNQVDPRGLAAFGLTGLAIFKLSWLMTKDSYFPKNLAYIGFVSGILLVVIYLGRLIILDPANPILLYPVLVAGFVVNPLWYLWLGTVIKKTG